MGWYVVGVSLALVGEFLFIACMERVLGNIARGEPSQMRRALAAQLLAVVGFVCVIVGSAVVPAAFP
ncbi:hypothetical protein HN371_24700 [Candidatus Poribacteria bacterium]|jgi:hypothetical protein|nr:hypothetical protein [Candidatus Poribacteria bacterium]MBT5537128.1 hypothetical protein [Candidatus Poribacteria bacterium]MBT5714268.1 hypothetical protein [Candidatus Poribacteria bacterium]MBT7097958.1 hypothetical protein [Candidatus Poribacteria bacterium]MBT7807205.1 hypothetical protein [Candidatus Poribacteria bacterium]